jgi:hypothetical protein
MKWPLPVAVAASLVTGALVLTAVVLAAFTPTETTIAWAAVGGVCAALSAGLGVVIARRARPNVIGALLGLVGLAVALTAAREIGWRVLAGHPATLASLDWLVALLAESSIWLFATLALLLLYFPTATCRAPGGVLFLGCWSPQRSFTTPTAQSTQTPSGRRWSTSCARSGHPRSRSRSWPSSPT